ncbi:MAG: hypothetical protein IJT62_05715 [Oscillospiraceae bacterium]|nr:hypothetical protein [Oscillospiraceae bacterium]
MNLIDFYFHVDPELDQAELNVETKTEFAKPVNEADASGMIHTDIRIRSKEENRFDIHYSALMIYSFQEKPEDTEEALKKIYESEGVSIVSDQLDNIMESMGKSPFKIKQYIVG